MMIIPININLPLSAATHTHTHTHTNTSMPQAERKSLAKRHTHSLLLAEYGKTTEGMRQNMNNNQKKNRNIFATQYRIESKHSEARLHAHQDKHREQSGNIRKEKHPIP